MVLFSLGKLPAKDRIFDTSLSGKIAGLMVVQIGKHMDIMSLRQEVLNWELPDWNIDLENRIKQNWEHTAIPLDSMGDFQGLITKIGCIQGKERPDYSKMGVLVYCADNGVVEEGISQCGSEVTTAVAVNMGLGKSSVNRMANVCGAKVFVTDVGMASEEEISGVKNAKIACGTKNFLKQPAMTEEETLRAMYLGMEAVRECKEMGYGILATGEMGIGNTTTSSAITAALLKIDPEPVTGKGAGLSKEGVIHKCQVIRDAIAKYDLYEKDPFTVLSTVGGLDLAALTGVFLGGAKYGVPIVLDGVITQAAALAAEKIKPGCKDYMIPSHGSREPASGVILEALGLKAVILANMALGEGTGAVMMLSLLTMAGRIYNEEHTFTNIQVEQYERFD